MYSITVSPKASKELKAIKKVHRKALKQALEEIAENPFEGKPLSRELMGRFSFRVGVYRIIYTINSQDKMIDIITAGHRGVVYR